MRQRSNRPGVLKRILASAVAEPLECRRLFAIPVHNSLPGAPKTLYLDFDGDPATSWFNGQTTYNVHGPAGNSDPVPAFDWDGSPATLNATETSAIDTIWSITAEKYSPFNINVTTVDPGNVTNGITEKVIIGGAPADWLQTPNSGISAIGGFMNPSLPNTCYVFGNQYTNNTFFVGNVAAHEAGHAFGLVHERWTRNPPPIGNPNYPEYYFGDPTRSPIMGDAGNNTNARGIWWKTDNWPGQGSTDPIQNELAVLTSFDVGGLSYRPDDHPTNTAGTLSVNGAGQFIETTGVIENTADTDRFTFVASNPRVILAVDNAANAGMLAPRANLLFGNTSSVVATGVETNTRSSFDLNNLVIGQLYTLQVFSQGNYGDIGGYRISGSMQSLTSYNASTRTVAVTGLAGNNNLGIYRFDSNTLQFSDQVNGGSSVFQNYSIASVDHVVVYLGSGDDSVTMQSLFHADGSIIDVHVDGGGGNDTINGWDSSSNANATTFYMLGDRRELHWTVIGRPGVQVLSWYDVDLVQAYGSSSNDNFNVDTLPFGARFLANGLGFDDVMTVGRDLLSYDGAACSFIGGPGNDRMIVDGSTRNTPLDVEIIAQGSDTAVTTLPVNNQRDMHFASDVETVSVLGGSADDSLNAEYLPFATNTVILAGNGGNDTFHIGVPGLLPGDGLPFSENLLGPVSVQGGGGFDQVFADDSSAGAAHTYTANFRTFQSNTSAAITLSSDTERMAIRGPDGFAATFNVGAVGTLAAPDMQFDGGGANDSFNFTNAMAVNATVNGGGGVDSLTVDDRTAIFPEFRASVNTTTLTRDFGTPASFSRYTTTYTGIESPTFYSNNGPNVSNVAMSITGTPASITPGMQWTVFLGNGNDTLTVTPHDAQGNLTINGTIGVFGGNGNDATIIDDSTSSAAINYSFIYQSSTTDVVGMGTGIFGAATDFESLGLTAGAGDDTFSYGGENVPNRNPWMTLDGGGGNDSLVVNDTSLSIIGSYFINNAAAGAYVERKVHFPSFDLIVNLVSIDAITINEPNVGSGVLIRAVRTGTSLTINGASGPDSVNTPIPGTPTVIQGPVTFHGGGGTNTVGFTANTSASQAVAHVTDSGVGYYPGDTYFGAGGSFLYDAVSAVTVTGGSGADTFYVVPGTVATISISAGDPTTSPGDTLALATVGVQDPSTVSGPPGSLIYRSTNRRDVSYTGIETVLQDDAEPITTATPDIRVDGGGGPGARQSVDAQFDEAVAFPFGAAALELTNQTSGQLIPNSKMALAYDPATRTAHFTFPGFLDGVLPDGNYHGRLVASRVTDTFGNALAADANFDFFFLDGDANRDRTINIGDFSILASRFNLPGTFSQGDFNYNGTTDIGDFSILASKFNTSLPAARSAAESEHPSAGTLWGRRTTAANLVFGNRAIDQGVAQIV